MADNVDATLEENKNLREQIEAIQQERRRRFADADRVHEEVLAREENERLKEVLASQERLLEDAERTSENASEGHRRTKQVPYTITKDGPVYSTPNQKGEDEGSKSSRSSTSGTSGTSRPPYVSLGGGSTDSTSNDENEEN